MRVRTKPSKRRKAFIAICCAGGYFSFHQYRFEFYTMGKYTLNILFF